MLKEWKTVLGLVNIETSRLFVVFLEDNLGRSWNPVIRNDMKESKVGKYLAKDWNA